MFAIQSIHPTSHLSIYLSFPSLVGRSTCGVFLYRLGNPMIDCRLSIIYKINFLSPSFSVFLLIYFVHALMHFTLTIFRILCCISYCRSPFVRTYVRSSSHHKMGWLATIGGTNQPPSVAAHTPSRVTWKLKIGKLEYHLLHPRERGMWKAAWTTIASYYTTFSA